MNAKATRKDRKRRLPIRLVLVLALGILVFSLTNGIERYYSSFSWTTTIAGRPATPTELFRIAFTVDLIDAVPFGVVSTIVFVLLFAPVGWRLGRWSTFSGLFVGGTLGCGGGIVLSIVLWLIGGGWGPPFLFPSIVGGTATGGATVALLQWVSRPTPGHCKKCDYDLTGNESGVCPECGTAV